MYSLLGTTGYLLAVPCPGYTEVGQKVGIGLASSRFQASRRFCMRHDLSLMPDCAGLTFRFLDRHLRTPNLRGHTRSYLKIASSELFVI
jgi:hypothetical protein